MVQGGRKVEQWEDVDGFEGIYEVSNSGQIRTHEYKTTYSKRYDSLRHWGQRMLKQKTDKKGYKRVCLYKDGIQYTRLVHRLVAFAFLRNPENKKLVHHKDSDSSNNQVSNLKWVTHHENLIHAFINKENPTPISVTVENKETGIETEFYSMGEASKFIGRNHGFISNRLKLGKNEIDEWTFRITTK